MKSDEMPATGDDEELFRALRDAMTDPEGPAPPEIEAQYAEMISAHFVRSRELGWQAAFGMALFIGGVLTVVLVGKMTIPALLITSGWALAYALTLKLLIGIDLRAYGFTG